MTSLIISILGIMLSVAFVGILVNYSSSSIVFKEKTEYKNAYSQLVMLNGEYLKYNNQPLDPGSWEDDLVKYGNLPTLPPKNTLSYNYDSTKNEYYFCITRSNPNKSSHKAMSGLRAGYPRSWNSVLSQYDLTESNGYNSSYFNVNNSCSSASDYAAEPLENDAHSTALSSTFWVGGLDKFYNKRSKLIEDDYKKLKTAFDAYVVANGSAPVVSTISATLTALRPYGEMPLQHEGFTWEYGLDSGSNYFCLYTTDTSSNNEQEREVLAESVYQLDSVFDNSYFKINRTSCTSTSQARTTDYSTAISVYSAYLLN